MSELKLLEISLFNYMFFMLIIAGLCTLIVYNVFLYFSLKEPSYLALIILGSALLVILYRDSNLFSILSFLNNSNNYFFSTPELIAMAAALRYWRYINESTDTTLDRFLQIMQWVHLLSIPIVGLLPNEQQGIHIIASIITPIAIIWISKVALTGHKATIGVYWGAITLLVTIFPAQLLRTDIVQYSVAIIYIAHAGVLMATILLSISQASFTRELRIRAERLDASNKAKDIFLTTMSHELRTPMHAVVGAGELLKKTTCSNEQNSYITALEIASNHMLGTINNILDLSSIEKNYLQLKQVDFQLNDLLLNVKKLLDIPAKENGLDLRIKLTSPIHVGLIGDPIRISQILVNLLSNAIKYTKIGTVELLVEPQDLNSHRYIVLLFAVTDTGIGIDKQQQKKLFSPFYQVEDGTERKYAGSGLGLSISYRLVEKMGGKLEVTSSLGKGSCFFFTLILPIQESDKINQLNTNQEQLKKPESLGSRINTMTGAKILLVDDDEMNLFIGGNLLQKLGANASLAKSGKDVIQQLKKQSFDLILMDISMPEMDGYETTRQIRANPINKTLPIIALTAHTMTSEHKHCIASGMNDFLVKPYTIDDIKEIVEFWLNKKSS